MAGELCPCALEVIEGLSEACSISMQRRHGWSREYGVCIPAFDHVRLAEASKGDRKDVNRHGRRPLASNKDLVGAMTGARGFVTGELTRRRVPQGLGTDATATWKPKQGCKLPCQTDS
ncbi:MAG TPA: hypothetical protein PKK23_06575 [Nitrospirales bacterium]|nr:hypothetical protein [Nitrospiraceae bacterium]HNP28689.1 hypothetical protein [Nitrospirales bacterium]